MFLSNLRPLDSDSTLSTPHEEEGRGRGGGEKEPKELREKRNEREEKDVKE
jgi:hypothetical protein